MKTKLAIFFGTLIALVITITMILITSAIIYMLVSLLNYCASVYIGFTLPQWAIILYSAVFGCSVFTGRVDKK